jgi:hypothetical protein
MSELSVHSMLQARKTRRFTILGTNLHLTLRSKPQRR